jgi:endonuclease YncB( thermonuclease family)
MEGTYAGKVVSIYDGDTCTIAIGAPFWATFKVRLLGIDTAEMRGSKDEPEESRKSRVALALKARNYLAAQTTSLQVDAECALKSEEWQNYIAENRRLVRLDIRGLDKYGRPLAIIHAADSPTGSPSTAEMLVDAGLAVAYGGGTKLNVVEQLTREESGGAQRERMLSSLREILYSCHHACQDGGQGRQKRQELGIDVKIEEEEEEGEE